MNSCIGLSALLCYVCPLCIFARRFPGLKFAGRIKGFSTICPVCAARKKSQIDPAVDEGQFSIPSVSL